MAQQLLNASGEKAGSDDQYAVKTVAAVDLGSNSFHMIVVEGDSTAYRVLDRVKESVRLAGGLKRSGRITDEARERALACLTRFGERLVGLDPEHVRAVGTNTLRQARDAENFLLAGREALGFPIEVISGEEEARLIYRGVAQDLDASFGKRLVVDIGGGSTELIAGQGASPALIDSLPVGAVTQSEQFFANGKIKRSRWRDAVLDTCIHLEPVMRRYREHGWSVALGSSGTIKSISRVANGTDGAITAQSLAALGERLCRDGGLKSKVFKSLDADRRPIFPGGLAVLTGVFESLDIDVMSVSDRALREGVIGDLLGRLDERDGREAGVMQAARTYGVDSAHAERVAATTCALVADVDTGRVVHQRAQWAARLHEIGMAIASKGYQKHGEYILRNADLPGFSRQEQAFLATVVRLHRSKFHSDLIKALPESMQNHALLITLALRLAAVLHRSRDADVSPPVWLAYENGRYRLHCKSDWLDAHPLTRADLDRARKRLDKTPIDFDVIADE